MVRPPYDMSIAAILLAAAITPAAPVPADRPGAKVVSVHASATIVEPAIVRQNKGLEAGSKDSPVPQKTERNGAILYEFE